MAGGISLATWLGDALTVWLCATALGLPLALPAAMFIASAAVLATAIPAAPGFVGTFELAVVAAGGAVGLGASTALALAVVMHLLMLVPASLAGGLLMARSGLDLGRLGRDAGAEPLKTPLESA